MTWPSNQLFCIAIFIALVALTIEPSLGRPSTQPIELDVAAQTDQKQYLDIADLLTTIMKYNANETSVVRDEDQDASKDQLSMDRLTMLVHKLNATGRLSNETLAQIKSKPYIKRIKFKKGQEYELIK